MREPEGSSTAGDLLIDAIADAVALRVERMAGMQQRPWMSRPLRNIWA